MSRPLSHNTREKRTSSILQFEMIQTHKLFTSAELLTNCYHERKLATSVSGAETSISATATTKLLRISANRLAHINAGIDIESGVERGVPRAIQRRSIQSCTAKSRRIARLIAELGTFSAYLLALADYGVILEGAEVGKVSPAAADHQKPRLREFWSHAVSRHVWLNLEEEDALRYSLFVQKYANTTSILFSHAADVAQIPNFPVTMSYFTRSI